MKHISVIIATVFLTLSAYTQTTYSKLFGGYNILPQYANASGFEIFFNGTNYIAAGTVFNPNVENGLTIISVDAIGNVLYANEYGGSSLFDNGVASIVGIEETSWGDIFMLANRIDVSDPIENKTLLKFKSDGSLIWDKNYLAKSARCFCNLNDFTFFSVSQANDNSFNLSKIDTSGTIILSKQLDYVNGNFFDCINTNDTIYSTGYHNNKLFLQLIDSEKGDSVFFKSFNWDNSKGLSLESNNYKEIVIVGRISDSSVVLKTNQVGDSLWSSYLNFGKKNTIASDIAIDSAGDIYITGTIDFMSDTSTLFVAKMNNLGVLQWYNTYPGERESVGRSITVTDNGYVSVTGSFKSDTAQHIWILKLNSEGLLTGKTDISKKASYFNVYPNPANNTLRINIPNNNNKIYQVKLIDINGNIVYEDIVSESIDIDVEGYSRGIYILNLVRDNNTESKKIIIQ